MMTKAVVARFIFFMGVWLIVADLDDVRQLMAVQLLGTGGIAALLLIATRAGHFDTHQLAAVPISVRPAP